MQFQQPKWAKNLLCKHLHKTLWVKPWEKEGSSRKTVIGTENNTEEKKSENDDKCKL